MSDVKVIGIGSPFGNDILGWQVIEQLKQHPALSALLPEHIELIEADRPGINLIHLVQETRFVVLIDAILYPDKHGEIIHLNKGQLIQNQHNLSSHALDVASAIALADKLQLLPEEVVILGLGINPERAEPIDAATIYKLTDAVVREIETYFSHSTTV